MKYLASYMDNNEVYSIAFVAPTKEDAILHCYWNGLQFDGTLKYEISGYPESLVMELFEIISNSDRLN